MSVWIKPCLFLLVLGAAVGLASCAKAADKSVPIGIRIRIFGVTDVLSISVLPDGIVEAWLEGVPYKKRPVAASLSSQKAGKFFALSERVMSEVAEGVYVPTRPIDADKRRELLICRGGRAYVFTITKEAPAERDAPDVLMDLASKMAGLTAW
jgi:hypothetical protein